jgi:hypothetical protein
MKRLLALALVAGFGMTAQPTFATGSQWTALIAYDDGGAAPQMIPIAADSEAGCLAAVSAYRGAEVIEPCHPAASAITDDNDHDRRRTGTRPPRNDGSGAGAGAGLGGPGHIGGG